MRFVGVDPGLTGGLALLNHDASRVKTWPMPVTWITTGGRKRREIHLLELSQLVEDIVSSYDDGFIVTIEQVSSSPNMGVVSAFNFGAAYMAVKACFAFHSMVEENRVIVQGAVPAAWKRVMRLTADKDLCRARARQLWPRAYKEFELTKDDGRAEAALLAEYGRLTWQQREGRGR